MADASIPVDLFNPGQVFGCLGFLEAADLLCGEAEGGFDWSNEADVRFRLGASGEGNPFGVVLSFLADAEVRRYAPPGYAEPPRKKKAEVDDEADVRAGGAPDPAETFPAPKADKMALPIRLMGRSHGRTHCLDVSHWSDASSRNAFKLYAGNRSAAGIACAMLSGTRDKPKRGQKEGDVKTLGVSAMWNQQRDKLEQDPFGILTTVGGSFNFDPRGAWTGIDAGYSPNKQQHGIAASPVVEILAAIGLEHARPDEYDTRQVRYAVWGWLLGPMLARPALAGAIPAVPRRIFSFELDLSGKNKVVTFAQEETRS
jgi:CRISPR-associated protein Csb3